MALKVTGSVPLTILCPNLFIAFTGVGLALALKLSGLFSIMISIGLTFIIPDILGSIAIAVELALSFSLAVGLNLPSFNLSLSLLIGAQLAIVESILLLLSPFSALANAQLEAFAYAGTGAGLGAAVNAAVGSGWPDGTPAGQNVTAIIFAATTTTTPLGLSFFRADQVVSLSLLPAQPLPPVPPPPPVVPAGATTAPLPLYESGIANVVFSADPNVPGSVPPGGTAARATVTITDNPGMTGIGAVTGITVTGHGSGYTTAPLVTISDTVSVAGLTGSGVPVVVTLPNALTVPISSGLSVTIMGVQGNTAANGQWSAKVLTATTVELYQPPTIGPGPSYTVGPSFVTPVTGNGAWVAGTGTVTGSGTGAAATPVMGGGSAAALGAFFNGILFPSAGLQYAGSLAFKLILGATFTLILDLVADLELQAGQLQAQLSAALMLPSVSGSVTMLTKIAATLRAALAAVPPMPSISLNFAASITAQFNAVAALFAQLGIQLGIGGTKLEVLSYTGPAAALGPALTAALGAGWSDGTGPGAPVTAVMLADTSGLAVSPLSVFFPGA